MGIPLFADTGIPLIGFAVFIGWFTIIPVAIVEAMIAMRMLRWRFRFAMWWVFLANACSMLLGIPIAWFVVAVASVFVGGGGWGDGTMVGVLKSPAWLGPGYYHDLGWAVPLALIVLCVPFFFMSWWIEYLFLYSFAARRDANARIAIRTYAWKANFASYTLLVIFLLGVIACRI